MYRFADGTTADNTVTWQPGAGAKWNVLSAAFAYVNPTNPFDVTPTTSITDVFSSITTVNRSLILGLAKGLTATGVVTANWVSTGGIVQSTITGQIAGATNTTIAFDTRIQDAAGATTPVFVDTQTNTADATMAIALRAA
jgi:hypothetical protein